LIENYKLRKTKTKTKRDSNVHYEDLRCRKLYTSSYHTTNRLKKYKREQYTTKKIKILQYNIITLVVRTVYIFTTTVFSIKREVFYYIFLFLLVILDLILITTYLVLIFD
tara:strand:+ start:132 stop:461 length:330 start_codon:yes stop_codon:yes gene_type:complete